MDEITTLYLDAVKWKNQLIQENSVLRKRIAELVLQAFAEQSHNTCFTMVRFGNVLDSSGSVIPLFKKQIREGGPITVTDANGNSSSATDDVVLEALLISFTKFQAFL